VKDLPESSTYVEKPLLLTLFESSAPLIELNVIATGGVNVQTYTVTNNKSNGFGLRFSDLFVFWHGLFIAVKYCMSRLMGQYRNSSAVVNPFLSFINPPAETPSAEPIASLYSIFILLLVVYSPIVGVTIALRDGFSNRVKMSLLPWCRPPPQKAEPFFTYLQATL
jgi:hypothetical protein